MASPAGGKGRGMKIVSAERPNTVGISERDLTTLLDKLEAAERDGAGKAKRTFARWPFRKATILVTIVHPGGTEAKLKLACRNLSRGGCSLLHNSYVHPGTACRVILPRADAVTYSEIVGTVKRCQHRVATLHELGIAFEHEIDLKDFMGSQHGVACHSLESVKPESLTGRLLLLEESDIDARIVSHYLRETGLTITHVKTSDEAFKEARQGFDMILMDSRPAKADGQDLVARIREDQVTSPILLMTADPMAALQAQLDLAGLSLLIKPLDQSQLLRTIAEYLLVKQNDKGGAPPSAGNMEHPLAGRFVGELRNCITLVEAAIKANDATAIRDMALKLKGTAPVIGFTQLAKGAEAAFEAVTRNVADAPRVGNQLVAAMKRTLDTYGG